MSSKILYIFVPILAFVLLAANKLAEGEVVDVAAGKDKGQTRGYFAREFGKSVAHGSSHFGDASSRKAQSSK